MHDCHRLGGLTVNYPSDANHATGLHCETFLSSSETGPILKFLHSLKLLKHSSTSSINRIFVQNDF